MYLNKQDKSDKQRKVQELYKKKINEGKAANQHNPIWELIFDICVWCVPIIIILNVWFKAF
ncbi:hypothetical protein CYL18_18950 [Pradoshia eiseniae]|uniref:Uncharacterized protein n=1 Tax=Pradoshia eiseniae TaxID=2064768 RepID=A0A2S7MV12_9BACI|nr:hypothetical protein [Pradoshia eiseniae]PQD93623.1 hypothetical protein CYL18_18950 [Pradoshia eiseniae]